jgi:hypothetical protein
VDTIMRGRTSGYNDAASERAGLQTVSNGIMRETSRLAHDVSRYDSTAVDSASYILPCTNRERKI